VSTQTWEDRGICCAAAEPVKNSHENAKNKTVIEQIRLKNIRNSLGNEFAIDQQNLVKVMRM
jgi:hypothetical protein